MHQRVQYIPIIKNMILLAGILSIDIPKEFI